jgi:hypothetical protein|tara:strand:- start:163 stop:456 length:294 start_codon:yes stop_codon:yes gene_type:complete
MSNTVKIFAILTLAAVASYSDAHSGRTDSNGGHNCSQKSKDKGLCTGYHYHNSGSKEALSKNTDSASASTVLVNDLDVRATKSHDHNGEHSHKHPTG